MTMQAYHVQRKIRRTYQFRYWLYQPPGYGNQTDQTYPLVLFLHGRGERGSDLDLLKKHGLPRLIAKGKDFPFLMAAPQCPDTSFWSGEIDSLNELLRDLTSTLPIDPLRIYVTGLSMGGYGTFHLACAYPQWFAAAVPICGGGDPKQAHRMKDIPTWVFHGGLDEVVPLSESERMVKALKGAGGDVRFTIYMQANHDSWSAAYNEPKLYEWMLAQHIG